MTCGVVLGLAVALAAILSPPLGDDARAAGPELTPAVKKSIDDSLLVFIGEVSGVRSNIGSTSGRQTVEYRVVRVLKGVCIEPRLRVQHVVSDYADADTKSPSLDGGRFAAYAHLILGVQLRPSEHDSDFYALINSSRVLKAVPWSQQVENAIAQYTKSNPGTVQVNDSKPRTAQEADARSVCVQHLTDLSQVFLVDAMENVRRVTRYSGPSLWLQYRRSGRCILRGSERVLLCPCDAAAQVPTADNLQAWDTVDLEHPVAGLCSYAGRDFAVAPIASVEALLGDKLPVGACLHHPGGAVVAYADGTAKFLTLRQLGLTSEAEKVVGPESKSPLLRVLR